MIRISIIEDDLTIRKNVITFIGFFDDLALSSESGSVEEFLKTASKDVIDHDVLLLDIGLPGMSGLEGISKIKSLCPELDIIMLTTYDEEEKIVTALQEGACSYLSKKTPLEKIIEAIRLVYAGGSYMSPAIARKLAEYMTQGKRRTKREMDLSPKQIEVIEGLVDGLSYKALAERLGISVSTIKTHIKRIYEALHVKSKSEAVAKYLQK